MSAGFEVLDRRDTRMGELSVRRRFEPSLRTDVYEVKLGDDFLMSSLFTVAEVALARLALEAVGGADLDVVVGGLGLGYTARAVLEDARVRSMYVVEALSEVIEWHRAELLPGAAELNSDPRCRLVHGDFFALAAGGGRFGADAPAQCHAVLVDIDHSPQHHLHPSHAAFYTPEGLGAVRARLRPGGVFALWSDDPPDDVFMAALAEAFESCQAHEVAFVNPYTDAEASNTVYLARSGPGSAATTPGRRP